MNFLDLARAAFEKSINSTSKSIKVPQTYQIYIHSEHWEDRKRAYFATHQKRCTICLTWKYIDLHHIRYSARGQEPDEDLAPLCRTHHDQFHQRYGTHQDMRRYWRSFVASFLQ